MANGTGIDTVRENLRLQQVYSVMLRYGLEMLLDQGVIGDLRRRMQQWIYHPDKELEALSTPIKMRLMLQELGPTYVKMGQIVSSRADVLPPDWEVEMNKLQSDVPPFPYEQVEEEIQSELGDSPQEVYAYFAEEPFAAASTAQVHRATLPSGEDVVVKVQRPGIRNQVKADLGIMGNAARVMERRAEWARDADFVGVLKEFGDNIVEYGRHRRRSYSSRLLELFYIANPDDGFCGRC
jgi:ubiquinone biosynthesis protein